MFGSYSRPRRFLVEELTPEQLADEESRHEQYRQYVGGYGDFDDEGRRGLKPVEYHHRIFDRY